MSDEKKIPKRRFKQFLNTPSWEQRKLGEVAEIVRGASPRPIADPKWFDNNSDIGWLRISDVTSQDGRIKSLEQRISKLGQEKTRVLMTPHLLLSIAATVGKPVINYVPTGVHDGFLIFMNPKFNIIYTFWWLEMFKEKWNRYGQPGSQVNLNSELVKNQGISLPSDEEQIAISYFFENIDNLITLHQRKLNKLENLKKAYLEELFADGNQCKPKRRFKDFKDDWEQRKLGEIATVTGGGTPSTNISEYWNGDIDWYSPVEIGENRYVSGSIRKITKLGLEKSSAKILPVGTVLFTSRAGIGNTAILQVEGCTNQGFQSITPNLNELDTYFLYTMTPKLKRYGEITGAGSTFVEVSGKQMEQMNLMVPSLEEQKRVSELFKTMDDAITLHQRKLQKLMKLKEAYLEEMFV